MASTIKGITVQIGGDTVNLNKALKGVDTTSKNLQRELNLVNKELKFNPDNAVLLAQKQEILTDKINATREKLQKLNEVQEQVERQAKSGDLGADEYRAYQREVETTKSKLEHLESELGNDLAADLPQGTDQRALPVRQAVFAVFAAAVIIEHPDCLTDPNDRGNGSGQLTAQRFVFFFSMVELFLHFAELLLIHGFTVRLLLFSLFELFLHFGNFLPICSRSVRLCLLHRSDLCRQTR